MSVPVWKICVSIVCIILSGTFSGLTLGLMAQDLLNLRLKRISTDERESLFADRILKLRQNGNFLLCTLLIGNTAVNSALSILTSQLFGGVIAFIGSTLAILYLGEIFPQAFCHKYGLQVGAYLFYPVRFAQIVTFPLSWPTGKILDWMLGTNNVALFTRRQLFALVGMHGEQEQEQPADQVSQGRLGSGTSGVDFFVNGNPACDIDLNESSSTGTSDEGQEHGDVERAESGFRSSVDDHDPNRQQKNSPPESGRWKGLKSKLSCLKRKISLPSSSTSSASSSATNAAQPALTQDETTVLQSALRFSSKSVEDVMTSLEDSFMLEMSTILTWQLVQLIFLSGHSRIPVFEGSRDNIVGLIFTKDLIVVDKDDDVSISTIVKFFKRPILQVQLDVNLYKVLNAFKRGSGHMAVVYKPFEEDEASQIADGDSTRRRKIVGIVTLEDLIEELIGDEIVDETDVYLENKRWLRNPFQNTINAEKLRLFDTHDRIEERLSGNESLEIANFLQKNIPAFRPQVMSKASLLKLLAASTVVVFEDHKKKKGGRPESIGREDSMIMQTEQGAVFSMRNASIESFMRGSRWSRSEIVRGVESASHSPIVYLNEIPTIDSYLVLSGSLSLWYDRTGTQVSKRQWEMLATEALLNNPYAPDFTASVLEFPTRLLKISKAAYKSFTRQHSVSDSKKLTRT